MIIGVADAQREISYPLVERLLTDKNSPAVGSRQSADGFVIPSPDGRRVFAATNNAATNVDRQLLTDAATDNAATDRRNKNKYSQTLTADAMYV